MDNGYDFPDIRELVDDYGYTAHIRRRGEENDTFISQAHG